MVILLINKTMSKYCPELFKNIYIEKQNQQQVKLGYCCQSKTTEPVDQIDFHHEFLTSGRQHYLHTNTLPDACQICTDLESNGADSLRTRLLKSYSNPVIHNADLRSIHYNCDPICNLKCIICSSLYSSSWIADDIALGRRKDIKIRHTKNNTLFWNLDLENIEFIYFNGGEPLLTNDHINLMEKISNHQSQRISLCYSTNGTIFPSEKVIALWSKFHDVKLQLSIDAVDQAIEYIRFPSVWHEIADNVQKLQKLNLKNLSISLAPNIGLHNLYYFEDLLKWATNSSIEMTAFPTGHTLSILNLPVQFKESAASLLYNLQKKYQSYTDLETFINLVNSIDTPDLTWISYLNNLDRIRNTNWKISLAKLYKQDTLFFDTHR